MATASAFWFLWSMYLGLWRDACEVRLKPIINHLSGPVPEPNSRCGFINVPSPLLKILCWTLKIAFWRAGANYNTKWPSKRLEWQKQTCFYFPLRSGGPWGSSTNSPAICVGGSFAFYPQLLHLSFSNELGDGSVMLAEEPSSVWSKENRDDFRCDWRTGLIVRQAIFLHF